MKKSKPQIVPLLILVVALLIWILDATKQIQPIRTLAPKSRTESSLYEHFSGCTLVENRSNDGDSFLVKMPDGKSHIIRLYYVDAPESAFKSYGGGRNNHERIAEQARYFDNISPKDAVAIGEKAKKYTTTLLSKAPFSVHTKWDNPFGDRRYHAFVEVTHNAKSRYLHELLVENGLVRIHTKGATLPDGTSLKQQLSHLKSLEQKAKSNQIGAWALH